MADWPDRADWRRLEPLLDAALELDEGPREAYVASTCSGDPALREELERLLESCRAAESFLSRPAADLWPDLAAEPAQGLAPGTLVGPYRILREAGRGGMASVYVAERADGEYRKQVALKLVSGGRGLDGGLARRFREERQILASLDHPHIARLLDGGVTTDALPWFALEYVDGTPIDRAAADRRLGINQRLRLFLQICDAVQYAHRNLVVHRDLKPSNIYLTPEGQVKLLDFGIAKLLDDGAGPDSMLQTMVGRWMTPEYAAPEQIRCEPITTATDVYQLGVVLYELLAGCRPFEKDGGTLHDLEQAVLSREPVKPSSRAGRSVRGDLDAIVLKALRKEPSKRYASVQELAADVENHLQGRAVAARRGTTAYRAGKFVRRHRWGVGMAAALVLMLAVYAVTVTVQTARVRVEAAKAEQVSDFLMGLFKAGDADRATGEEVTAHQLLERGVARADSLSNQPEVQAKMLGLMGDVYQNYGSLDRAQPLLERALAIRRRVLGDESADTAESLNDLGTLLRDKGEYEAAKPLLERALAIRRRLLGAESSEVATSMVDLARLLEAQGDVAAAERLQREALALRRRLFPHGHADLAVSINDLGLLLWRRGEHAAAEPLFREVLAMNRQLYGPEHWFVSTALNNLALIRIEEGDYVAAESLLVMSLSMKEKLLGENHPDVGSALVNLGSIARTKGDLETSESFYRRSLQIMRRLGETNPQVTYPLGGLGRTLLDMNRAAEAEPLYREAIAILERNSPDDGPMLAQHRSGLGRCLTMLGRFAEAESLLVPSYAVLQSAYGPADRRTQDAIRYLTELYTAQGKTAEATEYRALIRAARPSSAR